MRALFASMNATFANWVLMAVLVSGSVAASASAMVLPSAPIDATISDTADRKHRSGVRPALLIAAAARVIVDPVSLELLGGGQLDYSDALMGAHFTVRNPNATSSCGCGTSFSID